MNNNIKHMKWYGWGDTDITFNITDKPELWPFIEKELALPQQQITKYPVNFESIQLPTDNTNHNFIATLHQAGISKNIKIDKAERIIHSYGKSFRDLWRIRRGIIESAPDCVIYPETEAQIVAIINAANQFNVIVIPFGGGSNIAGCLEAKNTRGRMVVSLDMSHMDKVLHLDKYSQTARIQAGVMGPHLETQLNAVGYSLGHFPDSFEYSSLGGWVATRSAGMQSDCYGKIEDMVLAVRMVTPAGTIVTREVPRSSNGVEIDRICIGSEGILGVITEVTVTVHLVPEKKDYFGYMFPDFAAGVAAIHECIRQNCIPVMARLNDPGKTALSIAYKTYQPGINNFLGKLVKSYLKNVKKYDLDKLCLMLTCVEGTRAEFKSKQHKVSKIYRKHGAVFLGTSPGRAFCKGKYDFPYLRDHVMDYNIIADVSETATLWSNVMNVYDKTMAAISNEVAACDSKAWLGCHVSHNYQNGASLYFTFGCLENPQLGLQHYLRIKHAAEQAFIDAGATVSHHHAVGYEHMPWLQADISPTGVKALQGIKQALDPNNIMNPGKIIPDEKIIKAWYTTPPAQNPNPKVSELATDACE